MTGALRLTDPLPSASCELPATSYRLKKPSPAAKGFGHGNCLARYERHLHRQPPGAHLSQRRQGVRLGVLRRLRTREKHRVHSRDEALMAPDHDGQQDGFRDLVNRGRRASWWRRRGSKRSGFWYTTASGTRIVDEAAIERIASLVLPPAWTHVRISPSARSKLQ